MDNLAIQYDSGTRHYVGCDNCLLQGLCQMKDDGQDNYVKTNVHQRFYEVNRKQLVLMSGKKAGSIFSICRGSFKSVQHDVHGSRTVDFHLPGGMLGLEVYMSGSTAKYDLVATDKSVVSEFILPDYKEIESAEFLKLLIELSARKFSLYQDKQENLYGKMSTLQLVSSFIYSLALSHSRKNIFVTEFRIPITRTEIAEYYGLASETVSRQFVLLDKTGIIKTSGQRITILNMKELKRVARNKSLFSNRPGADFNISEALHA